MGIFKRGSVWYARYFEDGRVRRRSLRIGDRREAEGRFWILYAKAGEPDVEERTGRIPGTFGEFVDRWGMERKRAAVGSL